MTSAQPGPPAPNEHYFTQRPAGEAQLRRRTVRLRGREFDVVTAPGVFSSDGLDLGTRVLLDAVDDPPSRGTLVDVGCGWGPITLALAAASPQARVVAVDVNERALDLTRRNAATAGFDSVTALAAEAALSDPRTEGLAEIWSNPPVRVGKEALHGILAAWLPRLAPGGRALLVVQRNLGADSLHRWLETQGWPTARIASSKGFRVLAVTPEPY